MAGVVTHEAPKSRGKRGGGEFVLLMSMFGIVSVAFGQKRMKVWPVRWCACHLSALTNSS